MPRVETVEIFRDRNTGLYKLQRKCPHPSLKGPTSIGEPRILREEELRVEGPHLILDALASSLLECSDASDITRWDRDAYEEFRKNHEMVSISRWEDSAETIEVEPMLASEGGFRNVRGAKISVQQSNAEADLVAAIFDAFKVLSNR